MLPSPPTGRSRYAALVFMFIVAVCPLAMQGQQRAQDQGKTQKQDPKEDESIKLETEEVSIPVTVRNKQSGNLVGGLDKKDFVIYEDGVQQQIDYFTAEHVPVSIVLLIDTSSSVEGELQNIKQAAWRFICELDSHDKFSIISFTDTVDLMLDWTSDRQKARNALINLKAGKFTAYNDALYLAANEQLKDIKGRKAMIILSDGVDNRASATSYERAYDAVMRSEASVYIVSKTAILSRQVNRVAQELQSHPTAPANNYSTVNDNPDLAKLARISNTLHSSEDRLTHLAEDSGGRIYLPLNLIDLEDAYGQVATELKSQYIVNYVPTNMSHDGKFREVKVKVGRDGLRAYSRGGYYAAGDSRTVTLTHP